MKHTTCAYIAFVCVCALQLPFTRHTLKTARPLQRCQAAASKSPTAHRQSLTGQANSVAAWFRGPRLCRRCSNTGTPLCQDSIHFASRAQPTAPGTKHLHTPARQGQWSVREAGPCKHPG